MNFVKTDPKFRNGTGYVTAIDCDYDKLVSLLGEPHSNGSEDGKVQAEWVVMTDLGVVSIYDYKEDLPVAMVRDWHLGGKRPAAMAMASYLTGEVA